LWTWEISWPATSGATSGTIGGFGTYSNTPTSSAFFKGFSLFVGAPVTFGSSGLIGNLLAGMLMTYTRAFKVGDVVRIEGVYGQVTEKTLLVTRLHASGREQVSIPNSRVLAAAITNYSAHGMSNGVVVSVEATIGYDVDWRTVHKLLLDGGCPHRADRHRSRTVCARALVRKLFCGIRASCLHQNIGRNFQNHCRAAAQCIGHFC